MLRGQCRCSLRATPPGLMLLREIVAACPRRGSPVLGPRSRGPQFSWNSLVNRDHMVRDPNYQAVRWLSDQTRAYAS
eukprot:1538949-Pyramimonas_sp.AAC.1